jgi:hypothetical protein
MIEVFTDVIGFEDYFQISNLGNVFSKRSSKLLKVHIPKGRGYTSFSTKIGGRNGVNHNFRVHRLVAEAFIPNPLNKREVNHIDGNKFNNVVSNLEWVTPEENMTHAKLLGLCKTPKGVDNSNAKLSKADVLFIRSSLESSRKLASQFGVSHPTILNVKNGISYKDVV